MRTDPLNPRHIGAHAVAAVEFLAQLGLKGILTRTKHLRLEWSHGGRSFHISMPCTPRDADAAANQARQRIRREIRRAYG
ncbi:hypothetical protein [Microvirga mediterraneensis]|uniref:Uncharacterized protein n=1 Tax=Microvirga mediterraneensis TaxID=2754695 RepID=A0A838BWY6_9HYPH|nr:hypothetical protein [Microvirga mediterraneensis]MBA1159375.1 hypothetical protein [Microvirga mediterraneensis]